MTLDEAAVFLKANDEYIIVSHDGPDADGLGAAYALTLALRSLGKRAYPVLSDGLGGKFAFIDKQGLFIAMSSPEDLPVEVESASYIVVDTHDIGYLGSRVEPLVSQAERLLVLDHHEPKAGIQPSFCLDPTSSSTCEMTFVLAGKMGATLPLDACEAVFAGIVYDTGSFAYPKTGERTFAVALELVRAGVQPYAIHRKMYESSSVGVLILQKMVLSSLELVADNRVAIQVLRKGTLVESGAAFEDAEDLINTPLQGGTVEVSVFFKETMEGKLRCSLRSKGKVNVAHIAQNFGGGGHKTASGFTCDRPLEPMKAAVLETILKALES
jgi:phosphoesterase RecJ-like protein